MKTSTIAFIFSACLFLVNGLVSASLAQQAPSPQQFAAEIASSNAFEIEAARLVVERGKDPHAIEYAKDILRDHEKVSRDFNDAVKTDGLTVPTTLNDEHKNKLAALRTATEADFDQAYFSSQITSHEAAIRLLRTYADSGHAGALKAFAQHTIGTLRTHALRAHDLSSP